MTDDSVEPGRLSITPRGTTVFLAASIVVLSVGHLLAVYLHRGLGVDAVPGGEPIARWLNMDGETNVPAWFSAGALLVAGGLCAVIGAVGGRGPGSFRRHWFGLALILVFLSLDEAALIHEELSLPITNRLDLDTDTWRYWAWLVPYVAFALAVAIAYARFLWRLPNRVRTMIAVAGVVFVGGAAGMELVGRELFNPFDIDATYLLVVGIEEVLELTGISVLLVALVTHLRDEFGEITVGFGVRPGTGDP